MTNQHEKFEKKEKYEDEETTPDFSRELHLGDILKETGDCGLFQVGIVFIMETILVILCWSMMGMAYEGAIPDWQCVVAANDNGTVNATESKVCSINGTTCDYFVFDPDMRTIVSEWDLVCDKKWVSQTITTIQMAGLLVGGVSWGHVSDGIGRKPTLFINLFLLGVFNVLSYFSTGWKMFAAMRFFIGIAIPGFMAGRITFEYIRNKWRVYLEFAHTWALWAGGMAGVCHALHDWHYLHMIIACIAFPAMLLWFVLPESFRWLVSNGKLAEAEKAINYVARINRAPAPDLTSIRKSVESEQRESKKSKTLQVYSALDLFRYSKIRKLSCLFSFIWLFSAFSYYGIAFGVQELSGNLYMNMFLVNIVDMPGQYLLVLLNIWGGRRLTSIGLYAIGGVLALAVGILQYTGLFSGLWINILAFASKLFISSAWAMAGLWAGESFPTVIRNISSGVLGSVSRIGSIIAPQIINLSMDTPGLLYLGSGIVCLLSSIIGFFLEETKHHDLPDMLPHKHVERKPDREMTLKVIS